MFQSVYLHKVVTAFEIVIERLYEKLIGNRSILELDSVFELDEDDFYHYNDNSVWEEITSRAIRSESLIELSDGLRKRKPLKLAYNAPALAPSGMATPEHGQLLMLEKQGHLERLAEITKVDPDLLLYSKPSDLQFLRHGSDETAIRILTKDKESIPLVEDKDSIIHYLYNYQHIDARLYTVARFRKDLVNGLPKFFVMH